LQEKGWKKGEESMSEIKVLESTKERCSFIVSGANAAYLNSLRRLVLDYVPTMAIEDVEFRKNSSILYDEIIAHRLGLMPLKTDLKSYNVKSECKCKGEGCARCTLALTLKAKGPGMVYASQFKSKDPKVVPVYPEMPIVKLLKGQDIELEATAVLGYGRDHAKWSPGLAYYRHLPVVEIAKKCDKPDEVAGICPKGLFEVKNNALQLNKDKLYACDLCGACVDCSQKGVVKIGEKDDEFIFSLESWGQLTPKEIMQRALAGYDMLLDDFAEQINGLK
jgi:DNA-directed RNA polymerase subunit D